MRDVSIGGLKEESKADETLMAIKLALLDNQWLKSLQAYAKKN